MAKRCVVIIKPSTHKRLRAVARRDGMLMFSLADRILSDHLRRSCEDTEPAAVPSTDAPAASASGASGGVASGGD